MNGVLWYRLTPADCEDITRRTAWQHPRDHANSHEPGQLVPFVPVRYWSKGCCNGQAILDGGFTLWLTSRCEGTAPGTWRTDAPEPGQEVEAIPAEVAQPAPPAPEAQPADAQAPAASPEAGPDDEPAAT